MNVKEFGTDKLLLSMRFSGLSAALYYLTEAKLICSACGKTFTGTSTVTLMNRGEWWELMMPHKCGPSPTSIEGAKPKISELQPVSYRPIPWGSLNLGIGSAQNARPPATQR